MHIYFVEFYLIYYSCFLPNRADVIRRVCYCQRNVLIFCLLWVHAAWAVCSIITPHGCFTARGFSFNHSSGSSRWNGRKGEKYWLKEVGEEQREGRSKQCEGGCCRCDFVYMGLRWGWGKPGEVSHLSLHQLVRFKIKIAYLILYSWRHGLVFYCKSLDDFLWSLSALGSRGLQQIEWGHKGVAQQWPDNMPNCKLIPYDYRKWLFSGKAIYLNGLPPESGPNLSTQWEAFWIGDVETKPKGKVIFFLFNPPHQPWVYVWQCCIHEGV